MQYYIYGKGGNGKVIAWIIDKLNKEGFRGFKGSYEFIDDSSEECSLIAMQGKIKQDKDALILISSTANREVIADKLLQVGLTNYCDGVAYFGRKLNAYYQEKLIKNSCNKNIALLLDDLGFKHFGCIREILLGRKYQIFYFCLEHKGEFYDDALNLSHSLLLTTDFLPFLTFCPFIVGTSMQYNFGSSVKYLRLMPSYDIPFDHSYFHTTAHFAHRLLCYDMLSQIGAYSAVHCKKSYDKIRQVLDSCHYQYLLRLGYPSLDKLVKDYRDYESSLRGGGNDTVICLSQWKNADAINMKEKIIEVVNLLLENGYRVCYKVNPNYNFALQADIAKKWENNPNFLFFTERDLSIEELSRSITLVGFGASLLYTYPLITSKPSIILEPNSEWFHSNYHIEDNFYEQRLHLKAYCNEELLCYIDRLKKDQEFLKERRAMIAHYIKNETYNFGSASEAVVDFIDKYYKRWANKTLDIETT